MTTDTMRAAVGAMSDERAEAESYDPLVYEMSVALMRLDGNEGDPHQLVWEGGPVPEPWGDVWQKYEPQALTVLNAMGEASARAMLAALAALEEGGEPQPVGFIRPDTVPGRFVYINYYEGRNPALAWEPVYRAASPTAAPKEEGEPVTWGIFDSQGYYEGVHSEERARVFCEHYNNREAADPLKPYTYRPLYTRPIAADTQGDAKDAARYRWLRSDDIEVPDGQREILVHLMRLPFREDQSDETLMESELDEAVDAAMALSPTPEKNHG